MEVVNYSNDVSKEYLCVSVCNVNVLCWYHWEADNIATDDILIGTWLGS